MSVIGYCLCLGLCLASAASACNLERFFSKRRISLEENVAASGIVFRGVVVAAASGGVATPAYSVVFEVRAAYKGGNELGQWTDTETRRVNVTFVTRSPSECFEEVPREYVVFCELAGGEIAADSIATWDEQADERVWAALGWSKWSEWSSCSVSCSCGIQQRTRRCRLSKCRGFNVEQRHCNIFECEDAVNPLALSERRFFHPSKDRWQAVPDRPTAWRLKPNSYIWVPSTQLFKKQNDRPFPREFSLFITIRLHNGTMGTVFSLRSRRKQDSYLSLEVAGNDLKLIHAASNGTDVVRIPASLMDGHWHQIAVSIRDDSVVDSYVDCEWSRTDILRSHTLDIPDDSDLIIGYLFTGDLEQLTILPDPYLVKDQCSTTITPIIDPGMSDTLEKIQQRYGKRVVMKIRKKVEENKIN